IVSEVYLADFKDRPVVVRKGQRPADYLQWECELLTHLRQSGLTVPELIATKDGELHHQGIVVMEFIDGDTPSTPAHWHDVTASLLRLHELTAEWPQRPGCISVHSIATPVSAANVDLTAMPDS